VWYNVAVNMRAMDAAKNATMPGWASFSLHQTPFPAAFFESHPVYDQTQGSGAEFSLLYRYLY
jgi:hypothetical protein